jgi:hypothetical protein
VIGDEELRQLRDRDDEDEVEEELEPARVTFGLVRQGQQPRRREPLRPNLRLRRLIDADPHEGALVVGPEGLADDHAVSLVAGTKREQLETVGSCLERSTTPGATRMASSG